MILCPDCHGHDPDPRTILLEDFGDKSMEQVEKAMEPAARRMYPKLDGNQMTLHQSAPLWLSGERHYLLTTEEDLDAVAAEKPVVVPPDGTGKKRAADSPGQRLR